MAYSYHQLGRVAQDKGSYEGTLTWYRKAMEIFEKLGNRDGMAISINQIGVLLTKQGNAEEGLKYNLKSFAIRLELGVPQVSINLHWLGRQREALGQERFSAVVRQEVGGEGAEGVLRMVEEYGKKAK